MKTKNNTAHFRIFKSKAFQVIIYLLAFIIAIPLILIIFYIFKQGITKLNWNLFTQVEKPVGEIGGGILHALIGSLLIVTIASIIAIPISILCGIYLSENKNGKLAYWCRLAVDVLQGVPSIILGIVVYFWIAKPIGFSGLSGSVSLAIMMLPIMIRQTEETLKLVPSTLKEAGYALGLPYHKVILKVILPCGVSGIMSGITLSIARITGETAPLLFTAFGNPLVEWNIMKPMQSLPMIIYKYAVSPYESWHDLAWGAALVLLVLVLLLNILTKIITKKWNVQL